VDSKALVLPVCNAFLANARGRRNGEHPVPRHRRAICMSVGIPGGGKHPGLPERVALRGVTKERGPWSAHEDGGRIQPTARSVGDGTGCSGSSFEEGNLHPRRSCGSRRQTGAGPFSRVVRPAPPSIRFQRPSPQTVVGVRRCPQAASHLGGGRQIVVRSRSCNAGGGGLVGFGRSSQRSHPSSDGALFDGGRSSWLRKGSLSSATGANDGWTQASRFAVQFARPTVEARTRERDARE